MKSIFTSKVFYFNLLTIVSTIAAMFGYVADERVVDTTASVLLLITPAVNIILRFFTDRPVNITGK